MLEALAYLDYLLWPYSYGLVVNTVCTFTGEAGLDYIISSYWFDLLKIQGEIFALLDQQRNIIHLLELTPSPYDAHFWPTFKAYPYSFDLNLKLDEIAYKLNELKSLREANLRDYEYYAQLRSDLSDGHARKYFFAIGAAYYIYTLIK